MRNRFTAGYRRIQVELERLGIHLAGDTVRRLMRDLNIQVTICNRHQNRKYSSCLGTVGHLAPNRLHQNFGATNPIRCAIQMSVRSVWLIKPGLTFR
ncbi:IS3 family transposase [Ligilactobacillus ruminis]|uniref:IS3 family transposase n=1 Tax=Ligilactobacillus ruminis TaxID=1623 RepID=UPI003F96B364